MAKNKVANNSYFTGMESFVEDKKPEEKEIQQVESVQEAPVQQEAPVREVESIPVAPAPAKPVMPDQVYPVGDVNINGLVQNMPPKKYKETKSKRVTLLVKPSAWNALKVIAENEARSANDIVNELMVNYVNEYFSY